MTTLDFVDASLRGPSLVRSPHRIVSAPSAIIRWRVFTIRFNRIPDSPPQAPGRA